MNYALQIASSTYDDHRIALFRPTALSSTGHYTASRSDFIRQFYSALSKWRSATAFMSNPDDVLDNAAFRAIVSVGPPSVSLIMAELTREPSLLVWALEEIVGERPYPS